MQKTQSNIAQNDSISLILAARHVPGLHDDGAGLYINGQASFVTSGKDFEDMKARFSWIRAILKVTIRTVRQIN